MEGPSLYLAVERLQPFIGKAILEVEGNTRIGKERLLRKVVEDIFSWGKHLVWQFDTFALRIHFMLYGSYEATIDEEQVTGDYIKKNVPPRLLLKFENGQIILYNCSLKYLETPQASATYDFTVDIMSSAWNSKNALATLKQNENEEIADNLLAQDIFSGVGNIIKNEVLFLTRLQPTNLTRNLSAYKLKKVIQTAREFVFQFYTWRKNFVLSKHYQIYRQSACPLCKGKVTRKKTGKRQRVSFFCPTCQKFITTKH